MKHDTSTFLCGAAATTEFFLFAKEVDELAAVDVPNASFFAYDVDDGDDPYTKYDAVVPWPAISMATIKPDGGVRVVVAIGPNGDFWEMQPLSGDELVGRVVEGRANLRRVSAIGDELYVCGMDRVVYQRRGPSNWVSIGPGPLRDDPLVVGLEDIGGDRDGNVYAVGWGGEIWWRDKGGTWHRAHSPTRANLTSLTCTSDGLVYAGGHDGTLVTGRMDQWTLVDTKRGETLRDVAWHEGTLYAVTDFAIYRLTDAGLARETAYADMKDRPKTCLQLLEAPDGLVSLGPKDLFAMRGGLWLRLV